MGMAHSTDNRTKRDARIIANILEKTAIDRYTEYSCLFPIEVIKIILSYNNIYYYDMLEIHPIINIHIRQSIPKHKLIYAGPWKDAYSHMSLKFRGCDSLYQVRRLCTRIEDHRTLQLMYPNIMKVMLIKEKLYTLSPLSKSKIDHLIINGSGGFLTPLARKVYKDIFDIQVHESIISQVRKLRLIDILDLDTLQKYIKLAYNIETLFIRLHEGYGSRGEWDFCLGELFKSIAARTMTLKKVYLAFDCYTLVTTAIHRFNIGNIERVQNMTLVNRWLHEPVIHKALYQIPSKIFDKREIVEQQKLIFFDYFGFRKFDLPIYNGI